MCESRIFLSEAKAARDIQLNNGAVLFKEMLAEAEEPPADEEADEATRLGAAMENARSRLEQKVGSGGMLELGGIDAPSATMKSIIQATLSIIGEDSEVTEDWARSVTALKQTTPTDEVPEDESPPAPSSAVLEKLLETDTMKGSFMDPEASLCARYYLDCSKWGHTEVSQDQEAETMRGDSFHAHVLEQYLLAVQNVADHEILLTQKAAEALESGEGAEVEQSEES